MTRRKKRKMRRRALAIAISHIGETESPPNSNRCKFTKRWGWTGPWCAMFASLCYIDAGSRVFNPPLRWMSCPKLQSAAYTRTMGLRPVENPKPGDLVSFSWDRDSYPEHVGIFEEWKDRRRGFFYCIEGNTSNGGSQSNGGEVLRKVRTTNLVSSFVRVKG